MESFEVNKHTSLARLLGQTEYLDRLAKLSTQDRRTAFSEYLVADEPLELRGSQTLAPKAVESAMRIFTARAANGELERQFSEEARSVFYGENEFVVWSTSLESFLQGNYGETSSIPVSELVRVVTLKIVSPEGHSGHIAQVLRKTHQFTAIKRLSIVL